MTEVETTASYIDLHDKANDEDTTVPKKKKRSVISGSKAAVEDQGRGIVYLSHIPHGFYEKELFKFFSQFGSITNLRLGRSKKTGASRGYAFIEFRYADVANIVAETMNNYLMFEKLVKCQVVPTERIKPCIFGGREKESLPSGKKARRLAKKKFNAKRTDKQEERRANKVRARITETNKKLMELGISLPSLGLVPKEKSSPVPKTSDKQSPSATTGVIEKVKAKDIQAENGAPKVATINQELKLKSKMADNSKPDVHNISKADQKAKKSQEVPATTPASHISNPKQKTQKTKTPTAATPLSTPKRKSVEPVEAPQGGSSGKKLKKDEQNESFTFETTPGVTKKAKKAKNQETPKVETSNTLKATGNKPAMTPGQVKPSAANPQKSPSPTVKANQQKTPGAVNPKTPTPSVGKVNQPNQNKTPGAVAQKTPTVGKSNQPNQQKTPGAQTTPSGNKLSQQKTPSMLQAKTTIHKTPTAKTPTAKTPTAKTPTAKTPHLDLSILLGEVKTTPMAVNNKGNKTPMQKSNKKANAPSSGTATPKTPTVMEIDSDDDEISMKTPPNVQKVKSRNNSRAASQVNTPTASKSAATTPLNKKEQNSKKGLLEKVLASKLQSSMTPKSSPSGSGKKQGKKQH